jgi:hypothetical protein
MIHFGKLKGDCRKVAPLLWDLVRGELPEPDRANVETHLSRCKRCQKEAQAVQRALAGLDSFASAPLAPSVVRAGNFAEVQAQIEAEGKPSDALPVRKEKDLNTSRLLWPRWGVPVATVLAVSAVGLVAVGTSRLGQPVPAKVAVFQPAPEVAELIPRERDTNGSSGLVKVGSSWAYKQNGQLLTLGQAMFTLSVEPAFMGANADGTFPLVVRVQNSGEPRTGELSIGGSVHGHTRRVTFPTGDSRVVMYPTVHTNAVNGSTTFYASFSYAGRAVHSSYNDKGTHGGYGQVGYVGKKFGVLNTSQKPVPTQNGRPLYVPRATSRVGYCKPFNAPEIAAGYDTFRTVVLGEGVETMNAAQWQALDAWVQSGGVVVVSCDVDSIHFNVPQVRQWLGGRSTPTEKTICPVGVGRVIFTGVDRLTHQARRSDWFESYWLNILNQAALPRLSRTAGLNQTPDALESSVASVSAAQNPFVLKMPPLRTVVVLFAGYFMLVVPVTFVVLKQTRRMNWAWGTGPVIAVVFAGGTYLFNGNLYNAKQARRTAGIIVLQEGKPDAQFRGFTEMFFPHSGNYPLQINGAQILMDDQEAGYIGGYVSYNGTQNWTTRDSGTPGQAVATSFEVPNLSFRRVYHEQAVPMGSVISELKQVSRGNVEKALVGTVTNNTGRTLRDVWVVVPGVVSEVTNRSETVWAAKIGTVVPGQTVVDAPFTHTRPTYTPSIRPYNTYGQPYPEEKVSNAHSEKLVHRLGGNTNFKAKPTEAYLVGRMAGAEFGPQMGTDVGGDTSVKVVVALKPFAAGPFLDEASGTTYRTHTDLYYATHNLNTPNTVHAFDERSKKVVSVGTATGITTLQNQNGRTVILRRNHYYEVIWPNSQVTMGDGRKVTTITQTGPVTLPEGKGNKALLSLRLKGHLPALADDNTQSNTATTMKEEGR